jgi:hypothetical protein
MSGAGDNSATRHHRVALLASSAVDDDGHTPRTLFPAVATQTGFARTGGRTGWILQAAKTFAISSRPFWQSQRSAEIGAKPENNAR